MEIIALAYKTRAKFDDHNSVFYAFIAPAWAGSCIVETELHISRNDLLNYKRPLVSDSYKDAHKKAHLNIMSEDDYFREYQE